jgi:hypothetical protein
MHEAMDKAPGLRHADKFSDLGRVLVLTMSVCEESR